MRRAVHESSLPVPFSGFLRTARLFAAAILLGAGLLFMLSAPPGVSAQAEQAGAPVVRLIELDTTIDIVSARYLKRVITGANEDGVELMVIELDTPGGSLDSTRDMVNAILESEVPVVVYVSPVGSQAASAGTFIGAASGLLAMAPATNIGAASPVGSSGEDLPDTLANKATQDAAAFLESIADERGRNVEALRLTVTQAKAYSANEAVELNIADLIARNLDDLLEQIDGRSIKAHERAVTVDTDGARIERRGMSFVDRTISFLANPNIAFLLISLGTVGLIVELWNPGLWIPGTLGLAFLVLGWVGVGNLDFSWAGVIFLALAILLFVLEAEAPGVGYFGVAGAIALVIGGVFLAGRFTDPDLPHGVQTVSIWVLIVLGASVLAFITWLSWQIRATRNMRPWVSGSSTSTLVGKEAQVTSDLDPQGEVHVGGEFWTAVLAGSEAGKPVPAVPRGETVRVVRVDGVHLLVEPLAVTVTDAGQGRDDDSAPANV